MSSIAQSAAFLRAQSRVTNVLLGLVVIVGFGLASQSLARPDFAPVPADGFSFVAQGRFEVLISQSGSLQSSRNARLTNQCEYTTRIISVVPQGTYVNEGDVVMELDSSSLRELAQEREILLVQAEKLLKDAEEDLKIQQLTNESREADAELQARLAQLQYDGYREAQLPQQIHELESAIALAEEDVSRGRKKLEFVTEMVSLGYRNTNDREVERLALLKAEQAYSLAQDKLRVLTEFTSQRTLTQYQAIAEETQRELSRVKLAGSAAMLSRQVKLHSRQRTWEIHRNYLDRLNRNIAACTIRAPRSGEVILSMSSSSSRTPLGEGNSVRYLQSLASIPDRERMQVKLRIHESRIRLLQMGQAAEIHMNACDGMSFAGQVTAVSTVPLSGQYPNYDLREYNVLVDLTGPEEEIRQLAPGMTAQVAIHTSSQSDVLQVPLSSVVQLGRKYFTFLRDGDDVQLQEVAVGLSNDQSIVITSGLERGNQIVSRPRIVCAERLLWLERTMLTRHDDDDWFYGAAL
ncbi:MAG: efflux RND transporter periplasmic adaptor subunit [Planctomycetaceae bacterium]|nr:efflux RND transporter periplasmic adaptor subunit [Planctomycetaceae bacterium]